MSAATAWDGLLRTVRLPATRLSRVVASAALAGGIAAWIAVRAALGRAGADPLVVHVALWVVWLAWLATFRPAQRPSSLRVVYLVRVLPGAALAFAQLAGTVGDGLATARAPDPWLAAAGTIALVAGGAVFVVASRTLGVTRLAFVQEFGAEPLRLETSGLFGRIRHPCFAGAVLASVGAAALLGGVALELAAVNLAVLPFYVRLEDARLIAAHGATYADYAARVPAVIPRLDAMRRRDTQRTRDVQSV